MRNAESRRDCEACEPDGGRNYVASLLLTADQSSCSYGPSGSASASSRSAAARAKASIMLLRVDACRRCSGASQTISAPKASATISPVSLRKDLAGHFDRGGEEQPVAVQPVVHPFLVGAEIGDRGLDLDDPDFAVAAERHEIGAPAGRQRQLAHHAIAERSAAAARCRARPSARSADWRPSIGQSAASDVMLIGLQAPSSGTSLTHAIRSARSHARSIPQQPGCATRDLICRRRALGKAVASASRVAASTPRSVISPVTSRAGVTSKRVVGDRRAVRHDPHGLDAAVRGAAGHGRDSRRRRAARSGFRRRRPAR